MNSDVYGKLGFKVQVEKVDLRNTFEQFFGSMEKNNIKKNSVISFRSDSKIEFFQICKKNNIKPAEFLKNSIDNYIKEANNG